MAYHNILSVGYNGSGLPRRPLYTELTRGLSTIIRQHQTFNADSTQNEPKQYSILFLPASYFGMTEFSPTDSLIPLSTTSDVSSIKECKMWLHQAGKEGEEGILALLGMRTTFGTATQCFGYGAQWSAV
jgi:hypothetical protein